VPSSSDPAPESGSGPAGLPPDLPDAFRFGELVVLGVTEARLRRWLAEGLVERVGRGAYRRVGETVVDLDRLEVALRAPRATICLVSGLVEHDLVDDNPDVLDLALPRGAWQPSLAAPVRWHSFAAATFDLDRSLAPVSGDEATGGGAVIGLYGPLRCIVDVFRLRHEVGPEIGVEALKRWLRRPGSQPGQLLELARSFPAAMSSLTEALRVLL
jgi:Transcriptional regulator, AbiEi antitoxin